jgi:hypothetical protein
VRPTAAARQRPGQCGLAPLWLALLLLLPAVSAQAGRYMDMLSRGPFPWLQGCVLKLEHGDITAGAWACPTAGDWDADGDDELIVGGGYGDLLYFDPQPGGLMGTPTQMMAEEPTLLQRQTQFSPVMPAIADWDGDGATDLIIGTRGRVLWCRRMGQALAEPAELECGGTSVARLIQSLAPDCGPLAPMACDLDHDGDLDLVVGDAQGRVWQHTNAGTALRPALSPPRQVQAGGRPLALGIAVRPCAADWDLDGAQDLVLGTADGRLLLARGGQGGLGAVEPVPIVSGSVPADGLSGMLADLAPTAATDAGGQAVVLAGTRSGRVLRLERAGRSARYLGAVQGHDVPIDAGRCAVPCVTDWDRDGLQDVVVGGEDGAVSLYRRTRRTPPRFEAAGPLRAATGAAITASRPAGWPEYLAYAWPTVVDLDQDARPDLLLGQGNGRVALWLSRNGLTPQGDLTVSGVPLGFCAPSTVAAGDHDGDGDTDVLAGLRLLPGTRVRTGLAPEAVLYLENEYPPSAAQSARVPLFIKAVRADVYLGFGGEGATPRDAEILGVSLIAPAPWTVPGQYLVTTDAGVYLGRRSGDAKSYPRVIIDARRVGLPQPALPPVWSATAGDLGADGPGVLCGTEEFGWVVWYGRDQLGGPRG